VRRAFQLVVAAALLGACGGGAGPTDGGESFPDAPLLSLSSRSGGLHLELRSSPQPPVRGKDAVRLTFTDDGGAPVDGLDVAVQPWMPAMGHGSSVVPTVTARGQGEYDLSNLYLAMPGTWELRMTLSGTASDDATPSLQIP